jgi:hypothetical protein
MTRDSGGFFGFSALGYGKEAARGKGVRLSFINDERDAQGTMVLQGQMHRVLDQLPDAPSRFRLALDQGVLSLTAGLAFQGVVAQYPFGIMSQTRGVGSGRARRKCSTHLASNV